MALMPWSEKYSVGVEAIDKQHMGLVQTLNDLHAAMMKGQANNVVGDLLKKLVGYTREHFAAEERLMDGAKYPGLAAHRTKHLDLTKQIADFTKRLASGEASVSLALLNFLRDWLTTHILKEDKEYGPWLNDHGIK